MKEYAFHTQTFHPLRVSSNMLSVIPSKKNTSKLSSPGAHSPPPSSSSADQSNVSVNVNIQEDAIQIPVNPEPEDKNGDDGNEDGESVMMIECPICTELFGSERLLNSHLDTFHF
jgi:hypothetical protein